MSFLVPIDKTLLEGLAKGGVQACADPDIRQLLGVVAALHQIVDAVGYAIEDGGAKQRSFVALVVIVDKGAQRLLEPHLERAGDGDMKIDGTGLPDGCAACGLADGIDSQHRAPEFDPE